MPFLTQGKTNWKYILIVLVLAVIAGGLSFLFFVGFSRVSTNKEVYEIGEEIVVSFSDFRLFRCTLGPNLNFYYKTSGGWSKITYTTPVTFGRPYCIDGKLVSGAFPPDVVSCCVLCKPFLSGKYTWHSQIYEKKPEKEICGDITEPIDSYKLKPAPPGEYKIEFGRAKKIFEIKGITPSEKIEEETTNWSTYSNSVYNVEFKYPSNWQLKEEVAYAHRYEGSDGFFQVSAVSGKGLTIDEVCKNEAHHKLEPYGSQPKIEKLRIQNKEACLILPSDDQPEVMKNQTALIVQYPQPIQVSGESYNYFILWADRDHLNEIAKTFRFIADETANWKTYRNEELGFEIKYPSEISAGQVKYFPEEAGAMLDRCYIDFSFPEIFFSDKKSRTVFISSWTKFTKNFPKEINSLQELIDFYKETVSGEYRYGHDLIEETVELDGVLAKKISYSKFSYPENIKIFVVWVFFQHKERMYLIEGDTDFESKNKYLSVFDQMLSTFHFLK